MNQQLYDQKASNIRLRESCLLGPGIPWLQNYLSIRFRGIEKESTYHQSWERGDGTIVAGHCGIARI